MGSFCGRWVGRSSRRVLLRLLERVAASSRRDPGERNLQFALLTMAVILGVVIQQSADSFRHNIGFSNYRAVLLVTAILLFVEMYVVMTRYHERLELAYVTWFMFGDLVIALAFVSFVTLLNDSWTHARRVETSLKVFALLFVVLFLRQVVAFLYLVLKSKDASKILESANKQERLDAITGDLIFRNQDLDSRLTAIDFNQWALFVPMIADLLGVGFALFALYLFSVTWWSWALFAGFFFYELIMFGLLVGGPSATPVSAIAVGLGLKSSSGETSQRS